MRYKDTGFDTVIDTLIGGRCVSKTSADIKVYTAEVAGTQLTDINWTIV